MNYYVTQSGLGNQNGTSLSNAWDIAAFNSNTAVAAGDTVFFSGSFSTSPNLARSGSESAEILYDFASHSATIPYLTVRSNYIRVKGGTFASTSRGSPNGILAEISGKPHHIIIEKWRYDGPENGTTLLVGCAGGSNKPSYLTIADCHMDNISDLIMGDTRDVHHITIRNNYVRTSTNTTDQTDVIFFGDACDVLIEGNKFINRAPGDVTHRHNDVIQCFKSGSSANKTPTNWVIRYNWIEQSETAGDGNHSWTMLEEFGGTDGLKIYGNVFVGSGTKGSNGQCCSWAETSLTAQCHHNTYIRLNSNSGNTVRFVGATGKANFRNNVMQWKSNDGSQCFQSDPVAATPFDYNWFYNTSAPSKNVTTTHGSLSADPLFTDFAGGDYSTRDGSPLRGAADSGIGAEYAKGIAFGATWPSPALVDRPAGAWDVGAFQYSGTAPIEPPVEPPDIEEPPPETELVVSVVITAPPGVRVDVTQKGAP